LRSRTLILLQGGRSMRCRTVRKKLDRWRSQELTLHLRALLEAHLHECADCRRHLARQDRLATLLRGVSEPPTVPASFADRLMADAREQQVMARSVPASLERLRWLHLSGSVGTHAVQTITCTVGLLIGILLAQQTWQAVHRVDSRLARRPNPDAVQEVDYLMGVRGDSLAESYIALTSASSQNGT